MRILILGGGGREHAIARAVAASPLVETVFAAPGSDAMAALARPVAIDPTDGVAVAQWAADNRIDLTLVGPEAPLVAGVADRLRAQGTPVLGPEKAAARLEASKAFTHEICDAVGAPMAAWARFASAAPAIAHLRETAARTPGVPLVVKADGLAAGKGVVVARDLAEAEEAVAQMFAGAFGAAGAEVVIEEFLDGEEVSLFALSDGETVVPFGSAQDHKRAGEGDTGANTGGMGAYAPAPALTASGEAEAMDRIVRPVVAEMARRGTPYRGVLYAGLMRTAAGLRLIELNARFGDPEAQVILPRLAIDPVPVFLAAATGRLAGAEIRWRDLATMVVVMASRGYPGRYESGSTIRGLDRAESVEGVTLLHAGTRREGDEIRAAGGRVLNIVAEGADLAEARSRAYRAVDLIDWPGGFCRRDIGWRVLGTP
ncbi:MAG: phosphoribosylamine--glycine ligase [Paracoccaceae bacterium]